MTGKNTVPTESSELELFPAPSVQPLDRLSVREFIREVSFDPHGRGHPETVPLRFDVVLEIVHNAAALTDDFERVLSYRTIIDAIDLLLEDGTVTLLETLAERIAQACLSDPRAVQIKVQVEKLGGEAGATGVEIVRRRIPERPRSLRPVSSSAGMPVERRGPRPLVAFLPVTTLAGLRGNDWCDALAGFAHPCVVCVAPLVPQPSPTSDGQLRIGLLAIEQAAWALTDHDPRFQVVSSRAEIEWAIESGAPAIWAPAQMVTSVTASLMPDASDPTGLAAWLAKEIGGELIILGDPEPSLITDGEERHARFPEQLSDISRTQ